MEYRNAIRSKKMIKEAFFSLLKKKDINKITVTDIVTEADLNRSTFYAHYPDIRGILEELENEIIEKMMEILKKFEFTSFFKNPTPLLLEVSRFLESNHEIYKTLLAANGSEIFIGKLKNVFAKYMLTKTDIPEYIKDSKVVQLRVNYFAGGIINLYQEWFNETLDCSLNDIALEISKLLIAESKDFF